MQRKDYQDALNELSLSSEFCKKMEKKLSVPLSDEDEYEEIENHVEVIKHKKSSRFIAAVASFALICGIGAGAFCFRDDISKTFSNGSTETVTDYLGDDHTFNFPFGQVELSGRLCSYYSASKNATYEITPEQAVKLKDILTEIDWSKENKTESDSELTIDQYYMNNMSYDISDDDQASMYFSCPNTEDFFQYMNSDEGNADWDQSSIDCSCTVSFTNTGRIVVSTIIEDTHDYTKCHFITREYPLTLDQFNRIRDLLFYDESHALFSLLGVSADLKGGQYNIQPEKTSHPLSEQQAFEIANLFNKLEFERDDDYEPSNDDMNSEMCVIFTDDEYEYLISFDKNDHATFAKHNTDNDETVCDFYRVRENIQYKSYDSIYAALSAILNNGKLTDCPLPDEPFDSIFIRSTEGGKCTGFRLEGSEKDDIEEFLRGTNWRDPIFENSFMLINKFSINMGNIRLDIYENGIVYYHPNTDMSGVKIYIIDDPDKLFDSFDMLKNNSAPLSDDKLVDTALDLTSDDASLTLESEHQQSPTIKRFDKVREYLKAQEWEQQKFINNSPYYISVYSYLSSNYYTEDFIDNTDILYSPDSSGCIYLIRSESARFCLTKDGVLSDSITGGIFKCKDPDTLISQLNELLETS